MNFNLFWKLIFVLTVYSANGQDSLKHFDLIAFGRVEANYSSVQSVEGRNLSDVTPYVQSGFSCGIEMKMLLIEDLLSLKTGMIYRNQHYKHIIFGSNSLKNGEWIDKEWKAIVNTKNQSIGMPLSLLFEVKKGLAIQIGGSVDIIFNSSRYIHSPDENSLSNTRKLLLQSHSTMFFGINNQLTDKIDLSLLFEINKSTLKFNSHLNNVATPLYNLGFQFGYVIN